MCLQGAPAIPAGTTVLMACRSCVCLVCKGPGLANTCRVQRCGVTTDRQGRRTCVYLVARLSVEELGKNETRYWERSASQPQSLHYRCMGHVARGRMDRPGPNLSRLYRLHRSISMRGRDVSTSLHMWRSPQGSSLAWIRRGSTVVPTSAFGRER